ncbi:hypothetical protein [uncultured Rikenella sp.]|uniref:hypothetical protein n=1 Tax=uncultured Rikenella sp. TaxID=368003 RepID=UPI002606BD19|nr:hypothetical protein [uncultured Rikenella sp.]
MHNELLDTTYDEQFDTIESLRWRPWVGRGYRTAPRRLLIVGDSCYAQDKKGNPSPETEADFLQDKDTTRGVLNCNMEKKDTWRVYIGLCNMLVGGNEIEDRKKLWEQVAYYYLIQNRVMQTVNDEPNEQDYRHAWPCFLEVVKVLQPTDCLVLGVRNETAFGVSMEQAGLKWTIEDYPEPVGGNTKPRYATITWPDGHTLNLWFMKHPTYCSPEAWRKFFREKMPEAMKLF